MPSNDYVVAVVNDTFLLGGRWNLTAAGERARQDVNWISDAFPTIPATKWRIPTMTADDTIQAMQANAKSGFYTKMNISQCFQAYNDYWSPIGNLVVVVKNQSIQEQMEDTLLIYTSILPNADDWVKSRWAGANATGTSIGLQYSWHISTEEYDVDYCLAQPPATTTERCQFEYAPGIMAVVCVINAVKTGVMFYVWYARGRAAGRDQSLYTLGDAIASFMHEPDKTTKDMCLATKDDFLRKRGSKWGVRRFKEASTEPRAWPIKDSRFWISAATLNRWIFLLLL